MFPPMVFSKAKDNASTRSSRSSPAASIRSVASKASSSVRRGVKKVVKKAKTVLRRSSSKASSVAATDVQDLEMVRVRVREDAEEETAEQELGKILLVSL